MRIDARATSTELRVHVALWLVQAMFASLSVAGKLAIAELPPRAVLAVRAPVAAIILVAIRLLRPRERVAARDLVHLAGLGLCGIVVNQLLFLEGLQRTNATNAVVLNSTIPVFTMAVAIALRREQATLGRIGGLLLAFGGALTIALGGARAASSASRSGEELVGGLLLVANSLAFAIYLVASRPILQRYRTVTVVSWVLTFGAIGIVPFGAAPLVAHAAGVSTQGWLAIAWIILFPTVGTYFLNAYALRRAPASLVAIYIYLQPLLGAVMASIVLDERPSPLTLTGGLLIAVGIALVSRTARTPVMHAPDG